MSQDPSLGPTPETEDTAPPKRGFPVLAILPLVIFAGLAGIFAVQLLGGNDPARIPSAMIGRRVPDFNAQPLDGLARDGSAVPGLKAADLKGEVTVVNVFASWCVPCREEHPTLLKLAEDKTIRLVGLNYKDDPNNARRFLGQIGNPYTAVGTDPNGRIGIDWGVYGVPETFVVGPDGTIDYKFIGPLSDETLEKVLMPEIRKATAKKAG